MDCRIFLFPLLVLLVAVNYSDGRYLLIQVEGNASIGESDFPGTGIRGKNMLQNKNIKSYKRRFIMIIVQKYGINIFKTITILDNSAMDPRPLPLCYLEKEPRGCHAAIPRY